MKKMIMIALIAVITGIMVMGCEKENIKKNKPIVNTVEDFQRQMKLAGVEHNQCMEYIYNEVVISDSNYIKDQAGISAKEYFENSSFSQKDQVAVISSFEQQYCDRNNTPFLWFKETEEVLTEKQQSVLLAVESIIDKGETPEKIGSALDDFLARVLESGNLEEQYIAIVVTEIAKASLNYWYENEDKWANICQQSSKDKWFNWKNVGKEDVKGAVAGAVGIGTAAVVAGPPGWATGTATVAGAAAGASAAEAVGQVWDHIFGK